MKHVMLSLKPRWAEAYVRGLKTVEVRRQWVNLHRDDTVWLYATRPVAAVVASATVKDIGAWPDAARVWPEYAERVCLSYAEWRQYLDGSPRVCLIELGDIRPMREVSLNDIRAVHPSFHPPVCWRSLCAEVVAFLKERR